MYTSYKLTFLSLLLLVLSAGYFFQLELPATPQGLTSATPTYDPFAEPPLPANPTEYELGRNLYWHWCMTCHGDRGQGLTDQFRSLWEPEHQNCWARGCHAGGKEDMGFPIPKVVPALVRADQLTKFDSVQNLADFLKATHPPQSPGILKSEEYHAIAVFVFTLNGRLSVDISPTTRPASTSTLSPTQSRASLLNLGQAAAILIVLVVLTLSLVWIRVHTGKKPQ